MNATSAQLTIAWDGSQLRCEGASDNNGARCKIDGIAFSELPQELRDWLDARLTQIKDREKAKLHQLQLDNMQYVAQTHGPGLGERLYGKLKFSQALGRYHRVRARPDPKSDEGKTSAEEIVI